MTIRSRLAIAIAAILLVTFVVLGFALVQTTRGVLVRELDSELNETVDRIVRDADKELEKYRNNPPGYVKNPVVIVFVAKNGESSVLVSSGYSGDGDEPPVVPNLDSQAFRELQEEIRTISAPDNGVAYRARVLSVDGAVTGYLVVGMPLDDVQETVRDLIRVLLISFGAALAVGIVAVWLVIRQGMRPVDKMIGTAQAIAAGDLSQRVPDEAVDGHTELGKLGGALNVMLGQIERSSQIRDETEARLRQFVADAAHELRTPLTSLRGYAELYRQGALRDDAAVANAMGRIESEGTRMARLVDELLLLARLDQQRGLEMAPVNLSDLCREAMEDFRAVEPDRPVVTDIVPSAVVTGDRLRLRQIVDNLLTNARVHTPPGTPVRLTLRRVDGSARLDVHDDGPGIAAEDQAHVFERFWRGDRSRGRRAGSSGLGLSIVASIVESHGGTITVESAGGRGTSFVVTLPLAETDRGLAG